MLEQPLTHEASQSVCTLVLLHTGSLLTCKFTSGRLFAGVVSKPGALVRAGPRCTVTAATGSAWCSEAWHFIS